MADLQQRLSQAGLDIQGVVQAGGQVASVLAEKAVGSPVVEFGLAAVGHYSPSRAFK